jgi:hypothetical protein
MISVTQLEENVFYVPGRITTIKLLLRRILGRAQILFSFLVVGHATISNLQYLKGVVADRM